MQAEPHKRLRYQHNHPDQFDLPVDPYEVTAEEPACSAYVPAIGELWERQVDELIRAYIEFGGNYGLGAGFHAL